MNQKTWHECSWNDFIAEFTPSVTKKYLVVTRSTFENVYEIEASSADEAAGLIDDFNFYQKHIGEPVIRVAETPLSHEEVHQTLVENGYF